jgi:predicted metal-dependent enzyme (double-stranded beta helix superfamily)
MDRNKFEGPVTRREVLIGAGAALAATGAIAAESPSGAPRAGKLDLQAFIEDCKRANSGTDAQPAIQEIMERALANPDDLLSAVGDPQKGGLKSLYNSPTLTILNIVWSPLMQLLPHDHNMWAVIGIYTGREDNIFWERRGTSIAATRASAIGRGDVIALPSDVVHSVANPIGKLTGAIHIYGGDFFAGGRTEWDPESLAPRPWSIQGAVRQFEESNARFFAAGAKRECT